MEKWKFSGKKYLGIFENGHFKNVQNEKPRRLYFPVFSHVQMNWIFLHDNDNIILSLL